MSVFAKKLARFLANRLLCAAVHHQSHSYRCGDFLSINS